MKIRRTTASRQRSERADEAGAAHARLEGRLTAHLLVLAHALAVFGEASGEEPREWVRRTLQRAADAVAAHDHAAGGDEGDARLHSLLAEGAHAELRTLHEVTLALMRDDD